MEDDVLFTNVSAEVLEIYKYLDENIKNKFPKSIEEGFKKLYNKNHDFHYDVSKPLKDQNTLPETKQFLVILFLKYCCTKEERDSILKEDNEKNDINNNVQNIEFNNLSSNNIKKEEVIENDIKNNNQVIEYEEPQSWFKKIISKFKKLFIKRRV